MFSIKVSFYFCRGSYGPPYRIVNFQFQFQVTDIIFLVDLQNSYRSHEKKTKMVSINILIYKKQYFAPFFKTDFHRHQIEFQTVFLQGLWCIDNSARRTLLTKVLVFYTSFGFGKFHGHPISLPEADQRLI